MEAAPPNDLAKEIGLGHLRALCLAADAAPPPRPRQSVSPAQRVHSRRQRDQSSEYYVYLLVSAHACVFKLGHTRRLAGRVQTLRGKTRVLTTRFAHILLTGRASPGQVLAETFTNKAAREMRERVGALLGRPVEGLWLGTFHALCALMLRRHAEYVGLTSSFTILDTGRSDQAAQAGDGRVARRREAVAGEPDDGGDPALEGPGADAGAVGPSDDSEFGGAGRRCGSTAPTRSGWRR